MSGVISVPDALKRFLQEELVATLALPANASRDIHIAPMVFWLNPSGYEVYFVTDRNTEKCKPLVNRKRIQAGCVIGTSKGTQYCLQMRGHVKIVDPQNHKRAIDAYYKKRGNRNDDIDQPQNVLLEFKPSWIRCTDYTDGIKVQQIMK